MPTSCRTSGDWCFAATSPRPSNRAWPWGTVDRFRQCSLVIYAMFLVPEQEEKHRLLEEVIAYTDQAGDLANADVAAQFGRIYAKARLGEELSVPVVLKRGYTTQIPNELKALLAKQPQLPFALALYGGYEAGVIRKVGKLVGRMTYGVSADNMEKYFSRSFKAQDDLP